MNPSVTIYDYRWQTPPSQVIPGSTPSRSRAKLILLGFLRGIGSGLVVVALAMLIVSFGPIIKQEVSYRTRSHPTPTPESRFGLLLDTAVAAKRREALDDAQKYGVPTDFAVVIPKISAASPIVPNVNPADETSYLTALQEGVAHAAGSKFPGQRGTIYLFAHSTNAPWNVARYNAVFYLLKELEVGDDIIIFFAGQEYKYRLSNHFITDANDTSWLTDNDGKEQLILQTCWPPGTSLKRLIVIANPI